MTRDDSEQRTLRGIGEGGPREASITAQDVLVMSERRQVLIWLPGEGWDVTPGRVRLIAGKHRLEAEQLGTEELHGRPVVVLAPAGDWSVAMAIIGRICVAALPITLRRL